MCCTASTSLTQRAVTSKSNFLGSASSCWVDKRATVDELLNYCDVLALNLNGYWHILPATQSLDLCLLPIHLEPHRCCLTCCGLQCRNKKLEQFSEERDIVSEIQISEGSLAKCHTNRARFNCPFQQPIHACGKWMRGQHTALANTGLNFKPRVPPVRTQLTH